MNQSSPLDDHRGFIEEQHKRDVPPRHIATKLKKKGVQTSDKSVTRALVRWGLKEAGKASNKQTSTPGRDPSFSLKGDEAEILTPPSPSLAHPDDLLEERGLSTDDWEVTNLTVNEWDSPTGETLKQLKVSAKRKKPLVWVYPASEAPSYRVKTETRSPRKLRPFEAELVVFVGDQQAPYHNLQLHELFCEFLEHNQPDRGVLIGDTVDFPDISRHRSNPEWHVSAQECINSGYRLLRDYVQASVDTEWTKLVGNHDERIRNRLIDLMTGLYGITPAETGEVQIPAYSIRNLLHLDDLGIKFIDPEGGYSDAQVKLSPYLAARHGWIARAGSGLSALKTLEHLGYSVVIGHSHRQSLVHKTTHDIDGTLMTLAGAETGCMCRIEGGLGYAVAPDWANGFATASIYPDGTFKIDLATYVNGNLYWRDQRYV